MHDSSKERDNLARNGFVYLKKRHFCGTAKKKSKWIDVHVLKRVNNFKKLSCAI